jgi:predicted DsbA family dithiol-disulfide isomerase
MGEGVKIMPQPFAIDIVSDVVCPWCYIGKRNVEAALAQRPDLDFTVRWRPYMLDATIPAEGVDRRQYMTFKFGPNLDKIHAKLQAAGAAVGLQLNFDAIQKSPNTMNAHRLLHWAAGAGAATQNALAERLFADFFTEGRDVGDRNVLQAAAASVGMDAALVGDLLETDADRDTIQNQIIDAQDMSVTGVPFIILAGKFALPGAQPPDVILRGIDRVLEKRAAE